MTYRDAAAKRLRQSSMRPLSGGVKISFGKGGDVANATFKDNDFRNDLAYLDQWAPIDETLAWGFKDHQKQCKCNWTSHIKKCDTFHKAVEYAKTIDPKAKLDYIPMAERTLCQWVGNIILRCPKRGLLKWVGSSSPKSPWDMQKTKFYICRRNIGATVDAVVKAPVAKHPENTDDWSWETTPDLDNAWMISIEALEEMASQKIDAWKKKIPLGMGGYIDNLTPEAVYDLILEREMGINDLYDWLKWRDSDRDLELLGHSIAINFM